MVQVSYKKDESIALISIERPEALNALSREIVDEIDSIVDQVRTDDTVRCLILYSEKNFAAGADIKGMAECDEKGAQAFSFASTFSKIENLDVPVIAAIEGYALGGGLELALTADIRIAATSAKMGFPEVSLGIFPGAGGTIRAPRICGEAFAKELIFTGDAVTAERAMQIGLVNQVVEEGKAFEAALKMAKRIAARGPAAVRMVKDVIRKGMEEPDTEKAIDIETQAWPKLFRTEDQKEGMKAFIEKRKPVFKNK
ncbi:MAG: enoyl-CoA hydratase/isomerase family protein [Anaerovoracaceae bacterium]